MDILQFPPLAHGAEWGMQAYSRAADAYAALSLEASVALWAVGIAGGLVLFEWLLAPTRRRR